MFCNKKPGKYNCDCEWILCKEHSVVKNIEKDGKNINLVLFVKKNLIK